MITAKETVLYWIVITALSYLVPIFIGPLLNVAGLHSLLGDSGLFVALITGSHFQYLLYEYRGGVFSQDQLQLNGTALSNLRSLLVFGVFLALRSAIGIRTIQASRKP